MILAIDPGPMESACLLWDGEKVVHANGAIHNEQIIQSSAFGVVDAYDLVAIEMVACFGMAAGKELFDTAFWAGRFTQASTAPVRLVYRMEVKMHFCHSARANDSNIRQALIDRFGGKEAAIGSKRKQGPLYRVKGHLWSALAIGLYAQDTKSVDSVKAGVIL